MTSRCSEHGKLTEVLVQHARDAFRSNERVAAEWKHLNYSAPPDFAGAVAEYDAFLEILAGSGATIHYLPPDGALTLDSIYTRDASILGTAGVILCNMGKNARAAEPAAHGRQLSRHGWDIAGTIAPPGSLEGGDLIWLDAATVVVGQGRRTNTAGISQLRALLKDSIDALFIVPLPDYPGTHDVMHLMSLISPLDKDLALVYSRLLPAACRTMLLDRGYRLVDVPDEEFETMGTNVLALGPRDCLMLSGNPLTRRALERAGCRVQLYVGADISLKGGGGPTCLTRPLARAG